MYRSSSFCTSLPQWKYMYKIYLNFGVCLFIFCWNSIEMLWAFNDLIVICFIKVVFYIFLFLYFRFFLFSSSFVPSFKNGIPDIQVDNKPVWIIFLFPLVFCILWWHHTLFLLFYEGSVVACVGEEDTVV